MKEPVATITVDHDKLCASCGKPGATPAGLCLTCITNKITMQMKNKSQNPITEEIFAKHEFTQDELVELSRDLGRTCTAINTLESEKSAVTKDFASRIETNEIKRDSLVDKVTSGYEMRPTNCIVVLDPKNRSKDYFRQNPDGTAGEFVERREMTAADFQLALPEVEGGDK